MYVDWSTQHLLDEEAWHYERYQEDQQWRHLTEISQIESVLASR